MGSYEILSAIGVGGMGEVYRATTTLKRDVAVKVLPAALASDPVRLARFQREAEVLASLNHPHIAAIYGLERSSDVHALVMELVEGPTLEDRIAQGAIAIDEALPIARQIAGAAIAGGVTWLATRPPVPRVMRLTITPTAAAALTINGFNRDLAITPDGSRIVYVGTNGTQLFVRALDTLEPVAIFTGAPRGPFVWPDGQRFLLIKEGGGAEQAAAPISLIVVQHFDEDLRRLVRAN